MSEEILTIEKLKKIKPDSIFASGVGLIEHPWFNNARPVSEGGTLEDDGRSTKVRWIAMRGYIHDWAIYHSMDANLTQADYFDNPEHLNASEESIARGGAKLHNMDKVQEFVPCDEDALSMYRH